MDLSERKLQGKDNLSQAVCIRLQDTQVEVFICANVSRIEKYLDKLVLKITLRVAESGSAKVELYIYHELFIRKITWDDCFLIL